MLYVRLMPTYVARQGDCIASIAARFGVSTDDLAGMNDELLQGRDVFVLRAGDIVQVPERSAAGNRVRFSSGGTQSYRAKVPLTTIRLTVLDDDLQPVKNRPYTLRSGVLEKKGDTDGDGKVAIEVPITTTHATLFVTFEDETEPREFDLAIGHLDPPTDRTGVVQRLANLGLPSGQGGDDDVRAAVARFQEREGLEATGELTDETRQKLIDRHGI